MRAILINVAHQTVSSARSRTKVILSKNIHNSGEIWDLLKASSQAVMKGTNEKGGALG